MFSTSLKILTTSRLEADEVKLSPAHPMLRVTSLCCRQFEYYTTTTVVVILIYGPKATSGQITLE